jgi:enolase
MLLGWLERYPIVAMEDPLGEDDPEAMAAFTAAAGSKLEIVADDFVCTTTIVHLAVGWGVKQLKVGSFARSERMAKWNEGLRIAESLTPPDGPIAPRESSPWGR